MKITVVQKSIRQSPRKVRLVANSVKKLPVSQAILQLGQIQRKASIVVLKTLRQAIANAQHNHGLSVSDLTIASIEVGEGVRYRRFQPVSRGRAHGIIKRTSLIRITLESVGESSTLPDKKEVKAKKQEIKQKESSKLSSADSKNAKVLPAKSTSVKPTQGIKVKQPNVVAKPTRTKRPVAK